VLHIAAARMFRMELATSHPSLGTTTWNTIGQVSRQRFIVSGLEPYKSYWFRIVALGIDKEGLPSDVVLGRPAMPPRTSTLQPRH